MKRFIFMVLFSFVFIVGACSNTDQAEEKEEEADMEHDDEMMDHGDMEGHDHDMPLDSSKGENELKLPPNLEADKETDDEVYYTIDAQKGKTEIFDGVETETLGYNTSFLGPVVRLQQGQTAHLTLKNSLDEPTTFHWHGLVIEGEGDGGPHEEIQPGEEKEITFDVQQDDATLWFHPHPEGQTSKQVFDGLAGLLYIENEADNSFEYGKNDFPLILQDRTFDDDKQLDYEAVKDEDGTMGETLLVNGTVNPYVDVDKEKVRFRIINGSNIRNYNLKLSNGEPFELIASDGGMLNESAEMTELELTPSERAEIVIDFSQVEDDLHLMMDDDTVLLPFHVSDEEVDQQAETKKREDPVTITEEEKNLPVSKELELYGMDDEVTINRKQFDKDRIDLTQEKGETEIWEVYNK